MSTQPHHPAATPADEALVADELARLDAIANRPEADDVSLHAFIRAYAIRRLPVGTAAAILREEALRAFTGPAPADDHWASASWRLELYAKQAGISGWSGLPMAAEVRARARAYKAAAAADRLARNKAERAAKAAARRKAVTA